MFNYHYIEAKIEEYNSSKAKMENIVCNCFAVYKLSVKNHINQFSYVTDYETEKESMDYVERVYNLLPDYSNDLIVIPVKKNARGELFSKETNITESFVCYSDSCKVALMDRKNPFRWISVYNLKAGTPTNAIAFTDDSYPENWVSNPSENVNKLFIIWNL
jgi:hypothetical protein